MGRLEIAAVVILIANVPSCLLGLVWLGIGLDDSHGRWFSELVAPLLLFSYLPVATIAVVICIFAPFPERLRQLILGSVLLAGSAAVATMPFLLRSLS